MLDGTVRLLRHDVPDDELVFVFRIDGVRHSEVSPRRIAGEKDGHVEDLAGAVLGVWWQWQSAVGRRIEGDVKRVYTRRSG